MGGWSVMVMILCVYKWSQILVSVCVQVRLNVYKWSLCTSDPFLCVQVIPLPVKNVSNSSRPFLHFLHVCFFRPLHSFWRACLHAFSKSWDSRMPSAGFASKIHFRRIFQDRASGWSSQSLTEAPTRGVDFSDVKTFHQSLSHPGWPALRCPWMWSVGQVFSEPVQSPNVGMWRCA